MKEKLFPRTQYQMSAKTIYCEKNQISKYIIVNDIVSSVISKDGKTISEKKKVNENIVYKMNLKQVRRTVR